jgi:hypothetical protein
MLWLSAFQLASEGLVALARRGQCAEKQDFSHCYQKNSKKPILDVAYTLF